jgi:hypothetical protein
MKYIILRARVYDGHYKKPESLFNRILYFFDKSFFWVDSPYNIYKIISVPSRELDNIIQKADRIDGHMIYRRNWVPKYSSWIIDLMDRFQEKYATELLKNGWEKKISFPKALPPYRNVA